MRLNSGRHTQPPQSCRVRSLGGRGGAQKNKQRIKTKHNWAVRPPIRQNDPLPTQTQKKHPASSGISTSPTPCCESLRQQHPNNSKEHGASNWKELHVAIFLHCNVSSMLLVAACLLLLQLQNMAPKAPDNFSLCTISSAVFWLLHGYLFVGFVGCLHNNAADRSLPRGGLGSCIVWIFLYMCPK